MHGFIPSLLEGWGKSMFALIDNIEADTSCFSTSETILGSGCASKSPPP